MIFIAGFLVTQSRTAGIPAAKVRLEQFTTTILRMDKSMITSTNPDRTLRRVTAILAIIFITDRYHYISWNRNRWSLIPLYNHIYAYITSSWKPSCTEKLKQLSRDIIFSCKLLLSGIDLLNRIFFTLSHETLKWLSFPLLSLLYYLLISDINYWSINFHFYILYNKEKRLQFHHKLLRCIKSHRLTKNKLKILIIKLWIKTYKLQWKLKLICHLIFPISRDYRLLLAASWCFISTIRETRYSCATS